MKILPQMYLSTRKKRLNFGSHPLPHPDPGSFWKILQHCEMGIFPQFGSYLWKNWSDLHENLVSNVILNKDVPLNFGSHPVQGLYPKTILRIQRTRFALAEVCQYYFSHYAALLLPHHELHPAYPSACPYSPVCSVSNSKAKRSI